MKLQPIAIDSIVPDVPAFSEGELRKGDGTRPAPGHRALLMVFGTAAQPTARRVMVRLDANGSAYDFVDTRHNPDGQQP